MLKLINAIIQSSDRIKEIHLDITSFYDLLVELPTMPNAASRIIIDDIPIILKPLKSLNKISIILL
jgi:hypothetical protein